MAFDFGDFSRLRLGREILVNDADTAFLRQSDCQAGFGHGIHGCRDQRHAQADVASQLGFERNIARQYIGMCGDEQDVIKRQCFL